MTIRVYQNSIKQEKNIAIIRGAFRRFCRDGFDQTSVEEIAKSANVSLATLYKHFETKEQLFVASVTQTWEEIGESLNLKIDPELSIQEGLVDFLRYYVDTLYAPKIQKALRLSFAQSRKSPNFAEAPYMYLIDPARTFLANYLMEKGYEEADADMRARTVMACVHDMLIWPAVLMGLKDVPQETIDYVIENAVEAGL